MPQSKKNKIRTLTIDFETHNILIPSKYISTFLDDKIMQNIQIFKRALQT